MSARASAYRAGEASFHKSWGVGIQSEILYFVVVVVVVVGCGRGWRTTVGTTLLFFFLYLRSKRYSYIVYFSIFFIGTGVGSAFLLSSLLSLSLLVKSHLQVFFGLFCMRVVPPRKDYIVISPFKLPLVSHVM